MIFDIVVVLCVGAGCIESRIVRYGERFPTPYECMRYGMHEAVKVVARYPGMKVARYRCEAHKEGA